MWRLGTIALIFLTMCSIASALPLSQSSGEEIKIIKQDYIDKYFEWNFTKVNDVTYNAKFVIKNPFFLGDVKDCIKKQCSDTCWEDIQSTYLTERNASTVCSDIKNMLNYPRKSDKGDIYFTAFNYDPNELSGSFNIIINSESGEATFGFGSTTIAVTVGTPWGVSGDPICLDAQGNIYVVTINNTNYLTTYRSTDDGSTWSVIGNQYHGYMGYAPFIACDGSNIAYGVSDNGGPNRIYINASTNNGTSWTGFEWTNSTCSPDYLDAEILGNRLYIGCKDLGPNSNITGTVFVGLMNSTMLYKHYSILYVPPLGSVNRISLDGVGIGDSSDKIIFFGVLTNNNDMVFSRSTDGGVTWEVNVTVSETIYSGRILSSSTQIWYPYFSATTATDIWVRNWSWSGTTTTDTTVDAAIAGSTVSDPAAFFNINGTICISFNRYNRTGAEEREFMYECSNSTGGWSNSPIVISPSGTVARNMLTTMEYYGDYKTHYVYRNDSTSDYLVYDYIDYGGPSDTCTCPGLNQNWEIDMSDNCNITTSCELGTGKLNFTGTGNCYINATVNTTNMGIPPSGSTLWMQLIGKINIGG